MGATSSKGKATGPLFENYTKHSQVDNEKKKKSSQTFLMVVFLRNLVGGAIAF